MPPWRGSRAGLAAGAVWMLVTVGLLAATRRGEAVRPPAAWGEAAGGHGPAAAEPPTTRAAAAHRAPVGVPQDGDVGALLAGLAGTPPVACELVLHGLGNRWGASSVRPRVTPPLAPSGRDRELAELAWRGELGAGAAAALRDALAAPDPCVRRVAARLLATVDDAGTTEVLAHLARDATGDTRLAAILALGYGGRDAAVGGLAALLAGGDLDVRRGAAWALGGIEGRAAVAPLAGLLRDGDPVIRENATWALGRTEDRAAVAPLVSVLSDAAVGVRVNAAWALGEIEDPSAIPALAGLLSGDGVTEVRRAAAWALGRIEG